VRAQRWCDQGLAPTPWYLWPYGRLLDVACTLSLTYAPVRAGEQIDRLASLAARGSMRDLLVRAHLHRARAGSRTAMATARALAAGIDDPALHARLRRSAVVGHPPGGGSSAAARDAASLSRSR
jgi:hypothetical protein